MTKLRATAFYVQGQLNRLGENQAGVGGADKLKMEGLR